MEEKPALSDPEEIARRVAERVQNEAAGTEQIPRPPIDISDLSMGGEQFAGLVYAEQSKGKMIYNATSGEWLSWNDHYWKIDTIGHARAAVENVVAHFLNLLDQIGKQIITATGANDKDTVARLVRLQRELLQNIRRLRTEKGRTATLAFAACNIYYHLSITEDQLDCNPYLLACANGVIDLRAPGDFRPGKPEDFISRPIPTAWDAPRAPCSQFEKFIDEIFDHNREMVIYIQKVLGHALVGKVIEHQFFIFYGAGRNGKSLLFEILGYVLGDKCRAIASEMLLDQGRVKNSAAPSPDIKALKGVLIAHASETDEGRRFSHSAVKRLTGGDALIGRNPYDRGNTEFLPTHSLFMLVNDKPGAGPDPALWERTRLICFPISFVDREPQTPNERRADKTLSDKLRAEAPGILAWLVRGCLKWQKEGGLNPPPRVLEETAAYRRDEDLLGDWIEGCCVVVPSAIADSKTLYDSFCGWFEQNIGGRTPSHKRFGGWLAKRFDRIKGHTVTYHGIGLLGDLDRPFG